VGSGEAEIDEKRGEQMTAKISAKIGGEMRLDMYKYMLCKQRVGVE